MPWAGILRCACALALGAAAAGGFAGTAANLAPAPDEPLSLWYRQPAKTANEALPVGNGRLGALIYGDTDVETLALTEATFWSGSPYPEGKADLTKYVGDVQQLILNREFDQADRLVARRLLGTPDRPATLQPAALFNVKLGGVGAVSQYRRELNLDTAIAKVSYVRSGVRYTREVFASVAEGLVVMRLSADRPGQLNFTMSFAPPQRTPRMEAREGPQNLVTGAEGTDTVWLRAVSGPNTAAVPGGLRLEARARVLHTGGYARATASTITVGEADAAILLVDAGTSFKSYADIGGDAGAGLRARLAAAAAQPYAELVRRHLAEHQPWFRRVAFTLGAGAPPALPTDERLAAHQAGTADPALAALYFHYARYLLLGSSRPGGQPAAAAGLWKDAVTPAWQHPAPANFAAAYWMAESAALPECAGPLHVLVGDLYVTGARVAQAYFNAPGWVSYQQSDLWRGAAPLAGPEGFSPALGLWPAASLWERAQFSRDGDFVKKSYPILKGAAEFFLATMRLQHHSMQEEAAVRTAPNPDGSRRTRYISTTEADWLVTTPSSSPGETHPPDDAAACAGPTFDTVLVRELFFQTGQAAEFLGVDEELRQRLRAAEAQLPPFTIGAMGQLQPWIHDWEPAARGVTTGPLWPLAGLFPGSQITPLRTPQLAAACRITLNTRAADPAGLARGWRINLWARLHDGAQAAKNLQDLLGATGTGPNLLNARGPLHIEGNLAAASGIVEMLLQSHDGALDLLPALPPEWKDGAIRGLRARGGYEVALDWKNGLLAGVAVTAQFDGSCRLRYGRAAAEFKTVAGQTYRFDGSLAPRAP